MIRRSGYTPRPASLLASVVTMMFSRDKKASLVAYLRLNPKLRAVYELKESFQDALPPKDPLRLDY